ncbi:MAG TPA: hypothetical protein VNP96_09150 [Solirubrobacterales bacterium]|nr:hypothetical protein [Solirubrobacterales bacterium]
MAWPTRNAPVILLGAALLGSTVLLLTLQSDLTFFQDTWAFLMRRQEFTAGAFLDPHNEHIVVIPVAIEMLLVALFGMTSAAPEQVLLALLLAATAVLLFVYVRRRIGPWPALYAAVLLLFVGPAWQVLLWPFEIGFVGSVCFGIATLLALDRGDRRGDRIACACLVVAIGFSSLGVAFAAGAAVDVLQRRRSHGLSRAYVPAVPALLYAAWWLGWGHTAEGHLSLDNVLASPAYVFEGVASSLDSLLGLSTIGVDGIGEPLWGRPILIVLVAAIVLAQIRKPGFSPRLWPAAAAMATSWMLTAFNFVPGREAHSSRYVYAGAAFVLLVAADLLRGTRLGRRGLAFGAVVTIAAVGPNLVALRDGRDWFYEQTVLTRSDLAAIEIAHRTVDPLFTLAPETAGTPSLIDIQADRYLAAVREHGSPAYAPAELATAPPAGRRQADVVLARALPLSTETILGGGDAGAPAGECVTVPGGGEEGVPLGPGITRIQVPAGDEAAFSLGRFAAGYPVTTEGAPGGSTTLLEIPADTVTRPWRLRVEAAQPVTVCVPG